MTTEYEPSLSLLLLFHERRRRERHPEDVLVGHFGLKEEAAERAERCFHGVLKDGLSCRVRAILADDVQVVRCDLRPDGELAPAEAWERLTRQGEALVGIYAAGGEALPWAASWLYHAVLPAGSAPEAVPIPVLSDPSPAKATTEATPYGWLGLLGEGERPLTPHSTCWERRLLLVTPAERIERVRHYFLNPLMQGWARIERHLHKAAHHARLQRESSQMMRQAALNLRDQMSAAVRTVDFAHIYRESREMEQVSALLMAFLNQKAQAEMLLQSLRVNLHDFVLALEEVKLSTPLYEAEKLRLTQSIEQLQSDLEYSRAVTESAYTFQDMQHSIENNRLQRASLMLTTASALLAGFTIFNSFLDIWALILADSPWHLPPMGLRMALGALAGVSLPAAAYMLIERRYKLLFLWGTLSVLSLLLAVLSTIWVNR